MSGFFKKLFNRVIGKKEEAAPQDVVEQVALPAPAPEPVISVGAEVPAPAPRKPIAKKPAPKKPAPQKPEAKKAVVGKPEPKKAPAKAAPKATKAKPEFVKKPAQAKATPAIKVVAEKPIVAKPKGEKAVAPPLPPPKIIAPEIIAAPRIEPVIVTPAPATIPSAERKGWFSRLTDGLSKSSKTITGSITSIFTKRKLDKDTLQELEDTLI